MESLEEARAFGNKMGWLAIRSTSPSDVIHRLDIRDAQPTSSQPGIEAVYEREPTGVVYVTPPIDGWVLVAGWGLFSSVLKLKGDEAKLPGLVGALSATFDGEVQYFATHRVSEWHTWIRADRGQVLRAYGIGDGEVAFDRGALTTAETELAINFDPNDEGPDLTPANRDAYREWASHCVSEQMVMQVAARWSVNPDVEGRKLPRGWLGRLSF